MLTVYQLFLNIHVMQYSPTFATYVLYNLKTYIILIYDIVLSISRSNEIELPML